jgi:hypothetical protein
MVLDVPHPGQTGLTARTFEVLAAGVRLLTMHDRAHDLLPAEFADRIIAVRGIDEALALDFVSLKPLTPLTADQRYFLSLDRFVDALAAAAGIGGSVESTEPNAIASPPGTRVGQAGKQFAN